MQLQGHIMELLVIEELVAMEGVNVLVENEDMFSEIKSKRLESQSRVENKQKVDRDNLLKRVRENIAAKVVETTECGGKDEVDIKGGPAGGSARSCLKDGHSKSAEC